MNESYQKYEKRAEILKALAHPVRLMILDLLRQDNKINVTDLCRQLDIPQPTVSKHLSVLRNAGIINCERDKLMRCYCIDCKHLESLISLIVEK
ncbi:MAG: metalloregulator ArsR/SmtB family transcription factor [Bacillota bacterium]|nr:metalloregulator ArsR/SmtB family transcription factor [Bacillota bacterium]